MQTEDLRRFVTLARAEHLTAAADQLGIPQPSLSRSLRRVEDAFGARLFEREHRGLRLNPRGRLVLAAALEATAALDAAREQIAQLDDPESGTVRLAFLHSVATTLVPGLLREYRAQAPAVRFALRQEASPTIADDLDSGEAELAITGPRPVDPGSAGASWSVSGCAWWCPRRTRSPGAGRCGWPRRRARTSSSCSPGSASGP